MQIYLFKSALDFPAVGPHLGRQLSALSLVQTLWSSRYWTNCFFWTFLNQNLKAGIKTHLDLHKKKKKENAARKIYFTQLRFSLLLGIWNAWVISGSSKATSSPHQTQRAGRQDGAWPCRRTTYQTLKASAAGQRHKAASPLQAEPAVKCWDVQYAADMLQQVNSSAAGRWPPPLKAFIASLKDKTEGRLQTPIT